MKRTWSIDEAEKRFVELFDAVQTEGPQIVAQDGVDKAVVVPIDLWRDLKQGPRSSLKELLLASEARTDSLVPPRTAVKTRPPPSL